MKLLPYFYGYEGPINEQPFRMIAWKLYFRCHAKGVPNKLSNEELDRRIQNLTFRVKPMGYMSASGFHVIHTTEENDPKLLAELRILKRIHEKRAMKRVRQELRQSIDFLYKS